MDPVLLTAVISFLVLASIFGLNWAVSKFLNRKLTAEEKAAAESVLRKLFTKLLSKFNKKKT